MSFMAEFFGGYPEGTGVVEIHCDECHLSLREIFAPGTPWAEKMTSLADRPKETIMAMKEYYAERGWVVRWGYDLCPECAKSHDLTT